MIWRAFVLVVAFGLINVALWVSFADTNHLKTRIQLSNALHPGRAISEAPTVSNLVTIARADVVRASPFLFTGLFFSFLVGQIARWWREGGSKKRLHSFVDWGGVKFYYEDDPVTGKKAPAFYHNPVQSLLPVTLEDPLPLPADAPEIVREAFRAIAVLPGIPADPGGQHATSLLEHVHGAYMRVATKHGAASLSAQLVALHDLGKLLSYKLDSASNTWVVEYPFHNNVTTQAVMRLDAYWAIDHERRNELCFLLDALCNGQVPVDFAQHLREAVAIARAADMSSTAYEKAGALVSAIDLDLLCEVLRQLPLSMADFTINPKSTVSVNKGTSFTAYYDAATDVAYIRDIELRAWLVTKLPPGQSELMSLTKPFTSMHPANDQIGRALLSADFVHSAHLGKQAVEGWFTAAYGRSSPAAHIVIKGNHIPKKDGWALMHSPMKVI